MQTQLEKGFRETIPSFDGMDGFSDPSKLNEVQLALLENFTLKSYGNIGSLVSRNGFTRYGDTQIASGGSGVGSMFEATINLSGTATDLMIANIINSSSSGLYYKASPYTTGAWTAITGANGSAQGYKLNYASFKDKVYIANRSGGTATNAVWDGTTAGFYDMGCPPCNNKGITGTPETGGAKSYLYWITFLYDGFQESGALQELNAGGFQVSSSAAISTSSGITISSIPVSSSTRCTARKIYRCKEDATDNAYYVGTLTDNVSTVYVDRKPDSYLADPIDPALLGEIKKPSYSKYQTIHKERLIQANLVDSEFNPLVETTDITFTPSDTGGSMGTGVYKYKVFKGWLIAGTILKISQVLDKTIDMTALGYSGTDNKVTIAVTSTVTSDKWYNFIVVLRTKVGGSTYYSNISTVAPGFFVSSFPVVDTVADSALVPPIIDIPEISNYATNFPFNIKISDAGKPDIFSTIETMPDGTLIPAGNEWNVGETITGIHSEQNRIIIFTDNNIFELDTSPQSRQFWRLNKIVSGIGSDDGLQVQCGNRYLFVKTSSVTKNKVTVYEWDGNREPVPCEISIRKYIADLNTSGSITVRDIKFEQLNNRVFLFTQYTDDASADRTIVFIYNLDLRDNNGLGKWEIWLNSTNLNFRVGCQTKNYGMLIGSGDGYIHYQDQTANRDTIAGSTTNFTTKLRTKTWELYGTDLRPRRFRADITSSGSVTPVLKTAVDGTLNSGDNMTALASGFNRPLQTVFTNAQDRSYGQVYFQLEMTANVQQKVHGLIIDFTTDHEASGGR